MALDSLLIRLKNDVSPVSAVQVNIHAGFSRYGTDTADVSPVSSPTLNRASDTADTAAKNHPYQLQPAWNKARTSDTFETCKKINVEPIVVAATFFADTQKPAANDSTLTTADTEGKPLPSADTTLIDIGTVRPAGLTPALMAASLALDARIQAAGQFDNRDVKGLPTHPAVQLRDSHINRFSTKGVTQGEAATTADRLVQRDTDGDDRRLCLECQHLAGYGASSWRCGNWQAAGISTNPRSTQLAAGLVFQLQRCNGFAAPTQRATP